MSRQRSGPKEHYSITDLTREFEISTRTIRFYEEQGLIQPLRRGRTRLFRPADRRRLAAILRARRVGLSVGEIGELFGSDTRSVGGEDRLKNIVDLIGQKRTELVRKSTEIKLVLDELEAIEEGCMARLAELRVGR